MYDQLEKPLQKYIKCTSKPTANHMTIVVYTDGSVTRDRSGSRAISARLLRDGSERVWAFPSATVSS